MAASSSNHVQDGFNELSHVHTQAQADGHVSNSTNNRHTFHSQHHHHHHHPAFESGKAKLVRGVNALQKRKQKHGERYTLDARMEVSADDLCFGDTVALFCEESQGYVISAQSSTAHNMIAMPADQDQKQPNVSQIHTIQFKLVSQNRYKATKRFNKLSPSAEHWKQARAAARAEAKDNEEEQTRQTGKPVFYGQVVQLRHSFTGKFVHVNTKQTSWTESSNLLVELLPNNGKTAQFKIQPRYKVKAEGDIVQLGDLVQFESIKTPGQYLNCSRTVFQDFLVYAKMFEMNVSVNNSGFLIQRFKKSRGLPENRTILHGGSMVQLFHKEVEAYLAAEGVFNYLKPGKGKPVESTHLRHRPVHEDDPRTLMQPTTAIDCWVIEKASDNGLIDGSPLEWMDQVRLQHVTTRHFLTMNQNGTVGLEHDRNSRHTIFQVWPVSKRTSFVENKNFVRLQHVSTGNWLHAGEDAYKRKYKKPETSNQMITANEVTWSKAELRQVVGSSVQLYHDAFVVQLVPPDLAADIHYVAGMVPFLQKIHDMLQHNEQIMSRQQTRARSALHELNEFMIVNGVFSKRKQKLLRNFCLVDILVDLLKCHTQDQEMKQFISDTHTEAYVIMTAYLEGSSRKNELYLANHLEFFQEQLSHMGKVGLQAASMLIELLKDNREVIAMIDPDEIDMFADLLLENKCVLYYIEFGQNIGQHKKQLYVSTNKKGPWGTLGDLINLKNGNSEDDYKYLEGQLKLYSALAKGRNKKAIRLITENDRLLDFDRSFACMVTQYQATHGDNFRAVCAENIVDLFVDVHDNFPVMERMTTVFDYQTITGPGQPSNARAKSKFSGVMPLYFVDELQNWIKTFLDDNQSMIASVKEMGPHNWLVAKVLALVHTLVNYGYYGDTDRIQKLVTPILSLVNGRVDMPRVFKNSNVLTSSEQAEIKKYREKIRFKERNEPLMAAKYQGLRVLELYYNFRFNTQMQRFVAEYKKASTDWKNHALSAFMNEGYDYRADDTMRRVATRELDDMHEQKESSEFSKEFVETLQDLMYYPEEKVVTQALLLLSNYFSANQTIFEKCIETQLLLTPRSRNTYSKVRAILPQFGQLSTTEQTEKNSEKLCDMLQEFIVICCLDETLREPHPLNQEMLYNCGVLSYVFDLMKPFNQIEAKHDNEIQLLKQCLRYLKTHARGFDAVKNRIFDRLDFLLSIKGADAELAAVIIETFTDNLPLCLRVKAKTITRLVRLYTDSLHPVWLSVLAQLAVSATYPLKRNQHLTVKALMAYPETTAVITKTNPKERSKMIKEAGTGESRDSKKAAAENDDAVDINDTVHQLCSLLHVFSLCAYGDNKSVESICQCLMTMDELLTYATSSNLCAGLRLPVVMFLTQCYLRSYAETARAELVKYNSDKRMEKLFKSVITDLDEATYVAKTDLGYTTELLWRRPANLHRSRTDTVHEQKELLHYVFDGILPLLRAAYVYHWGPTEQADAGLDVKLSKKILKSLEDFAESVGPALSNPKHSLDLVYTIYDCSSACGQEPNAKIVRMLTNENGRKTEAQREYDKTYAEEIQLNGQFDDFASNMLAAYEGRNSVKQQLGIPIQAPYYLDNSNPMPLGEQFQQLVACFRSTVRYRSKRLGVSLAPIMPGMDPDTPYMVQGLVNHLAGSLNKKRAITDSMRLTLSLVDKRALQVLRAIIHNEFARIDPENTSRDETEELMKDVELVQNTLDSQGVAMAVLPHLARTDDALVRECFNVLYLMYKSNIATPANFVESVNQFQEESFFVAVQTRLHSSSGLIKEKRFLDAVENQAKMEKQALSGNRGRMGQQLISALHRLETVRGSARSDNKIMPGDLDLKKSGSGYGKRASFLSNVDDDAPLIPRSRKGNRDPVPKSADAFDLANMSQEEQLELTFDQDFAVIIVIMKTIQALCDLEFEAAQHLMREQLKNVKSINVVSELCTFLSLLYSNVDENTMLLLSELLETLIETVQGNTANQAVFFDRKGIDFLNHLMQSFDEYADQKALKLLLRMHDGISLLLKLLTEENQNRLSAMFQSKTIMTAVNKEALMLMASRMYQLGNPKRKEKEQTEHTVSPSVGDAVASANKRVFTAVPKELRDKALNIGFNYYHLLHRANDLDLFSMSDYETKDADAYTFYFGQTHSIEIVHEGFLQRLYFRNLPQTTLRLEVQERLKWEVDRSSEGNKVRDFMQWVRDIYEDIRYQRRINSNFFGKFFVQNWKLFNVLCLLITFILNLFMILYWDQLHKQTFWTYHSVSQNVIWRALGICQNILSACLVLSYFLSNAAGFASSWRTYKIKIERLRLWFMRKVFRKFQRESPYRPSKLEVNILGGSTFYYVAFLTFSVLGTIVSPCFFAFHLLQIINNNQLLARVIQSVTVNGKSLLWVGLLGTIVIYMHALAGFIALRSVFQGNLHFCDSLLQCTASMFREGLVYRTMRVDYPVKVFPEVVDMDNKSFSSYAIKMIWDMSFFVLVLTIGLNVIFGIIVDTFRQLRDAKWRIEQDIETKCFICGRLSYEFDQKGIGFKYHCSREHSEHAYVLFFVRLQDMHAEDMTHMEMYTRDMANDENFNYFPLNRAISLRDDQDASIQHELIIIEQLKEIEQVMARNGARQSHEFKLINQLHQSLYRKTGESASSLQQIVFDESKQAHGHHDDHTPRDNRFRAKGSAHSRTGGYRSDRD